MTDKLKMLFWGMLSAMGALVLEFLAMIFAAPFSVSGLSAAPAGFMPVGVFIEELFALVLIGKLLANTPTKKSAFPRALIFGLGFSLPEILLNLANRPALSQAVLLSFLGLLLIHSATAGIFGYYFSKNDNFRPNILFFFILALLSHLAFNFSVLADLPFLMIAGLPMLIIFLCFLALKMPLAKDSLPI